MSTNKAAEFKAFCKKFSLSGGDRATLYHLVTPVKANLGLSSNKSLIAEVTKCTGVKFGDSDYKLTNLASGKMDEENAKAIIFYLYEEKQDYYCNYMGHTEAKQNPETRKRFSALQNMPFWEIFEGLPNPNVGTASGLNSSNHDEVVPRADLDQKVWELREIGGGSFDHRKCRVALRDFRQRPLIGEPVEAYLELYVSRPVLECGLSYGFTKVQVETDIDTEAECRIHYAAQYASNVQIGKNGVVNLAGAGPEGILRFTAVEGTFDERFELNDAPMVTMIPTSDEFRFDARVVTSAFDLSIANTDGSPLPPVNKEKVIKTLLLRDFDHDKENGWVILCTYHYVIQPEGHR